MPSSKLSGIMTVFLAQIVYPNTSIVKAVEGLVDRGMVQAYPVAFCDVVGDGEFRWDLDVCYRDDSIYITVDGNTTEQVRYAIEQLQTLFMKTPAAWAALSAVAVVDCKPVRFALPIEGPDGVPCSGEIEFVITTSY